MEDKQLPKLGQGKDGTAVQAHHVQTLLLRLPKLIWMCMGKGIQPALGQW